MIPSQTAQEWKRSAELFLQQADAAWSRPGGREAAVVALYQAAVRWFRGAEGGAPPAPASAGLSELASRAAEAKHEVLFFAGPAIELSRAWEQATAGFLPTEVDWARLGVWRDAVKRLAAALFPSQQVAPDYAGTLVCISGPSGVGKSTICKRLVERMDAVLSVSATTRPRRENEVDGRDYWFISRREFERRLEEDGFLEYARVYGGEYYGTPAEPVMQALAAGRVVILEIEIEGTIQIVRRFPETVTIYVLAPSSDDQARRLIGRQEDSEAAIQERLSKADGEIRYAKDCGVYRYFVVNAVLEETVDRIASIIRSHARRDPMRAGA